MRIMIDIDGMTFTADLNGTETARKIAATLPIEGRANRWGEEIYFEIPVDIAPADGAVEEVSVGALAYWPTGRAMCIFFGPTPVSTSDLPRAYSPVNVFGSINEDATRLTGVKDGAVVKVTAL